MISIVRRFGLNQFTTAARSNLYLLPKLLKDVTKIKGLQKNTPFIQLDDFLLHLDAKKYLAYLSVQSNKNLLFYDQNLHLFSNNTPVMRLFIENFYVSIDGNLFFVLNNEPIIKHATSPHFKDTQGSYVLQGIIGQTLQQLQDMQTIDRQTLHNYFMKDVVDNADELKLDKIRYKELLKFIEGRIRQMEEQIKIVEQRLQRIAKNRVRLFTSFLLFQAAIVQYFIYFNLSWDIMEPITVLMGNFDILVAYYFFLLKGKTYSPQTWHKQIVQDKKFRYLAKQGLNIRKYEEYIQIRAYLKMRLGLLSKNPLQYMQTVEKPFKLLNTR